jgi:ADP-ribose pyrophosphatase YjhB (NUDIX family)
MEQPGRFIIRVYGLVTRNNDEVLVTDEFQLGQRMTKFPGGGLQFGEGPVECLIREIEEECNGQKIKNIEHYYTTGFFQQALFYPNHQLISIYYTAQLSGEPTFTIANKPFAFDLEEDGSQSFRWVKIKLLNPVEFSFPIDKLVAEKFRENKKPSV